MATDEPSGRPPRRRRYSGPNPRHFQDKYKEQQPHRYPNEIDKAIQAGKTPAGMHRPIMVAEILEALDLSPGDVVADCTLGYGGHAQALLSAVQPGGRLFGIDSDPIELPKTEARLRSLGTPAEALVLRRMNFAGTAQFLAAEEPGGVDGLMADLGVSSMQLDDPNRGFGFKVDGPLDMRMNPNRGKSAMELLSTIEINELTALLRENADEPNATFIARAILNAHHKKPLATTHGLADIVRSRSRELTKEESDNTIRRVFQALRISVNDEFGSLESFLRQLPHCLKSGGKVAILSFHSGEDRRVKSAFKQGLQDGHYTSITREVIRPSLAELRSNSRSSSAKLRLAVRR